MLEQREKFQEIEKIRRALKNGMNYFKVKLLEQKPEQSFELIHNFQDHMENWRKMPKKISYEQYSTYLTSLLNSIEKAKDLDSSISVANYEQYFNIIVRKWLESEIKPKIENAGQIEKPGVWLEYQSL